MDLVTLFSIILGLWLLLAICMTGAWSVEQRTGNAGWVDVIWTCAMGLTGIIGATALVGTEALSNRQLMITGFVVIWALRLAGHITNRTTRIADDPRYEKLRAQWGPAAPRNMFWLLQVQAALSVPMVLAIMLAAGNPADLLTTIDGLALLVLCCGLAGSAIADWQLTQFKQTRTAPAQVCNTGLWAWSRHPNYFFEWLVWMGLSLFAINLAGDWPWGYLALIGPICMFWLLRYVSGVPPLEEHMLAKYGAAYKVYQRETSVFLPLPPRTITP